MQAPELRVERWINTAAPLTLAALRGRAVLMGAFQIRCTGCVMHTIPQLARMHEAFSGSDLVVLGLHTVFEDHASMTADALADFIDAHELRFPIGIDLAGETRIPQTMRAYDMQGTPTTVLIDATGTLQRMHLGPLEDEILVSNLAWMLMEPP